MTDTLGHEVTEAFSVKRAAPDAAGLAPPSKVAGQRLHGECERGTGSKSFDVNVLSKQHHQHWIAMLIRGTRYKSPSQERAMGAGAMYRERLAIVRELIPGERWTSSNHDFRCRTQSTLNAHVYEVVLQAAPGDLAAGRPHEFMA